MTTFSAQLLASLTDENHAVDVLIALIQQEQAALVDANVAAIEPITQQKAELIARLADLANKRHAILATANCQPDETGMQIWLDKNSAPEVHLAWQNLLDQVKVAKELNRTNSLLVNTHLARTRTALNTLRGGNQTGNVYGANGQTANSTKARAIVSS
ncbi:MAG: flagellar protein FlgN [Sulfuriferula sp.]